MKYHYIHKKQEKFINEHEYKIALKKIDEAYGVTLGLSKVLEFIKNKVEMCVFSSERTFPRFVDIRYLKMNIGPQNLSKFTKIDIDPYMFYTDCIFEFTLKDCNSRLEWIDFENTKIEVICRVYDTIDPDEFRLNSDKGSISSSYTYVPKNNKDDSYIIGDIKIRIDMEPIKNEDDENLLYFIPYTGGYDISDIKNIVPLLQHEFNHMHKKIKMNTNQDVTDLYNVVLNVLKTTHRGNVLYRFADALYRYCIQDELNANVEQAFKEYQYTKDIEATNTWTISENTKYFLTKQFNINSNISNKNIYNTFSDSCKKVLHIRNLRKFSNSISDKEINLRNKLFVKALIKKILQNIDKLQERIKRTTKVPIDVL